MNMFWRRVAPAKREIILTSWNIAKGMLIVHLMSERQWIAHARSMYDIHYRTWYKHLTKNECKTMDVQVWHGHLIKQNIRNLLCDGYLMKKKRKTEVRKKILSSCIYQNLGPTATKIQSVIFVWTLSSWEEATILFWSESVYGIAVWVWNAHMRKNVGKTLRWNKSWVAGPTRILTKG